MAPLYAPEYVFDSGAFIKMREYPPDIFSSLWGHIGAMLDVGRIISCREVYREVAATLDKEDDASRFAKANKNSFLNPSPEELIKVSEIMARFPKLTDEDVFLATKPQADPFVIAQAALNNCAVIHTEKFKPNAPKIPNVCLHFGVREMNLLAFCREQGWTF